jgi:predicted kinase
MCYKRIMREWMRGKLMRRRKKPAVNDSESTGKIGHEIPKDQPAPLQPSYLKLDDAPAESPSSDQPDLGELDGTEPAVSAAGEIETKAPSREAAASPPGERRSRSGRDSRRRRGRGEQRSEGSRTAAAAESRQDAEADAEPESSAQPAAQAEAPRAPKGTVVLAIGLPGSGKTTWFKRRSVTPLSSDMLRLLLFDDATEQRHQGLVFSTLRSLLRARLIAHMPWNYVDATNLSFHERRQWIKMARSFGYEVHAVFFDVPFEICMERNRRRDRMVSEESMLKMQERLRPPSFQEGFHKITVVRVKNSPEDALQSS